MEKLTVKKPETIVGGQTDCEGIFADIWLASTTEGQQSANDLTIRFCND